MDVATIDKAGLFLYFALLYLSRIHIHHIE